MCRRRRCVRRGSLGRSEVGSAAFAVCGTGVQAGRCGRDDVVVVMAGFARPHDRAGRRRQRAQQRDGQAQAAKPPRTSPGRRLHMRTTRDHGEEVPPAACESVRYALNHCGTPLRDRRAVLAGTPGQARGGRIALPSTEWQRRSIRRSPRATRPSTSPSISRRPARTTGGPWWPACSASPACAEGADPVDALGTTTYDDIAIRPLYTAGPDAALDRVARDGAWDVRTWHRDPDAAAHERGDPERPRDRRDLAVADASAPPGSPSTTWRPRCDGVYLDLAPSSSTPATAPTRRRGRCCDSPAD